MSGAMVRVPPETREKLRQLAADSGESMQSVLAKALEAYRRQQFLDQANRAYARLRQDPSSWDEEQSERAVWDAVLADDVGLEE